MARSIALAFILSPFMADGQLHTGSLLLADSIIIKWTIKDFVKKERPPGYCYEGRQ